METQPPPTTTPIEPGMVGDMKDPDTETEVTEPPEIIELSAYWANWHGKIQRVSYGDIELTDLVSMNLTNPRDIAVDSTARKIYWVDASANKVQRANLDGTNVEDLIFTEGRPFGIALDLTNKRMYWSTWAGKISSANLDGSNVQDAIVGLDEPEDIALDVSSGKIYWIDSNANVIQSANLDGTNIQNVISEGLSHQLGIALDLTAGKIYWTNTSFWPLSEPHVSFDKIQRANLDGTNIEDLVTTDLVLATGIALDISLGKMYWSDSAHGIFRANLDGSNVEPVIEKSIERDFSPQGIALGIK